MAEAVNEPTQRRFCDREGERYIAIDGKSLKKSPSVWSLRDYTCEACGKTFTQYHTLHKHTKFREIFQKTKLRHTTGAESKHWLGGPDIKYWLQQLNFTVFCATPLTTAQIYHHR